MNYTFLLEQDKRGLKQEYRIRVFIVLMFFVSVGFIVGICSLFPAYIYASLEEGIRLNQATALKQTEDNKKVVVVEKQLSASSAVLNKVYDSINSDIYFKTINSIVAVRGNIRLNSFSIEHPNANSVNVVVSGLAPTRGDLLAFKSRLQVLAPKISIDLPLSTLAQDSKISFSIQINETIQ